MSRVACSFLRILIYADLSPLRICLGLSELIWAASLLWPGDSFSRPAYAGMQALMQSEIYWGMMWLAMSACQFYIVFSGKYHTRFAVCLALFNFLVWTGVVISIYLVFWPPAAALSGEVVLAIGAGWVFIRSGWTPLGDRRNAH